MLNRFITATLVTATVLAVAGPAQAADPAPSTPPRDRIKPQITSVKYTPRLVCNRYDLNTIPSRTVTFTLSEPATVTLHKLPLLFGVIPLGYSKSSLKLDAGVHALATGDYGYATVPPTSFPTFETFGAGRLALSAKDAAGNESSLKWSGDLTAGEESSSHGSGTNGCP